MIEIDVYVSASIGYVGCKRDDTLKVEIDDEWSEAEIEEVVCDHAEVWKNNYVEWYYEYNV